MGWSLSEVRDLDDDEFGEVIEWIRDQQDDDPDSVDADRVAEELKSQHGGG